MYEYVLDEGATINSIKLMVNEDMSDARRNVSKGKQLMDHRKYDDAIVCFTKAKKDFLNLRQKLNRIDETEVSSFCSYLIRGGAITLFINISTGGVVGFSNWILKSGIKIGSDKLGIVDKINKTTKKIAHKVTFNKFLNRHKKSYKPVDTDNYIKADCIKLLEINIDICDKLIRKCNELKNTKTESTLFESIYQQL